MLNSKLQDSFTDQPIHRLNRSTICIVKLSATLQNYYYNIEQINNNLNRLASVQNNFKFNY